MAPTRTLVPFDAPVDGPLIRTHPSNPTAVTVALPTVPGAALARTDARRLARQAAGAERRLARVVPSSLQRTRTVHQLRRLVDRAGRMPTSEGLALVAGPLDGRIVRLDHPTTVRVVVGPPPSFDELVEAVRCIGRVAVLHATGRGCRLVCADGATLWEPRPPWDPVRRRAAADPLVRAHDLLDGSPLGSMPVVVAGDDRIVARLRPVLRHHHGVAAFLAGDHSETSIATLATLARRVLRRQSDEERRSAVADPALVSPRAGASGRFDVVGGG